MGSWHKTCALTNTHIVEDAPVYVFPLMAHSKKNLTSTTSTHVPWPFAFEAIYDGHGTVVNTEGFGATLFFKMVIDKCAEKESDDSVTLLNPDIGVDEIYRKMLKNSLRCNDHLVNFSVMRKDAVDYILENFQVEYYHDGKVGQCSFDDMFNKIPEIIDAIGNRGILKSKFNDEVILIQASLEDAYFNYNKSSESDPIVAMALRLLYDATVTYTMIKSTTLETIAEYYLEKNMHKVLELCELMESFIRVAVINDILDKTRRTWQPMSHEGSQSNEIEVYLLLNKAVELSLQQDNEE